MDFFQRQDRARRNTRLAILFFASAVVAIVATVTGSYIVAVTYYDYWPAVIYWPPAEWWTLRGGNVMWVALGTMALIGLGSAYEIAVLAKGSGEAVARSVGGVQIALDTQDLGQRRLVNVVQEMAIASGLPAPALYLLPQESGINAFAAGLTVSDAVIGVTQGAVDKLNRDELQGVVAHEFSHIIHGDMRLNLRLMGVLHGILLIAIVGSQMVRSFRFSSAGSRRSRGGANPFALVVVGGMVLVCIGYIGLFFARIIKAVVSRQREFLADASAVQFTRNPDGIAGALKTIAGYKAGSNIASAYGEEVSHMLFGAHRKAWLNLFATHPPLAVRIAALDPSFKPQTSPKRVAPVSMPRDRSTVSAFSAAIPVETLQLAETTGRLAPGHIDYAIDMLATVPAEVLAALTTVDGAESIVLAVAIHPDPNARRQQLGKIKTLLPVERLEQAAAVYKLLRPLGPAVRLPLLDLALPAIRQGGVDRARGLVEAVHVLALADGELSAFEFALVAMLRSQFRDAFAPAWRRQKGVSLGKRQHHVRQLFSLLAKLGAPDAATATLAYDAGMMRLFGSNWPDFLGDAGTVVQLESALDGLDALTAAAKRQLVDALTTVAAHDGVVSLEEYELLRAICATIHCPMPPLVPATMTECLLRPPYGGRHKAPQGLPRGA